MAQSEGEQMMSEAEREFYEWYQEQEKLAGPWPIAVPIRVAREIFVAGWNAAGGPRGDQQ